MFVTDGHLQKEGILRGKAHTLKMNHAAIRVLHIIWNHGGENVAILQQWTNDNSELKRKVYIAKSKVIKSKLKSKIVRGEI